MDDAIKPFVLSIQDEVLADLQLRLKMTRWPEDAPAPPWQQGVPLRDVQRLHDYWMQRYDWRRCEKMLNAFGQYRTTLDGLGIHFLHVRSPEPDALPLLLTHGWPGSVIEFHKVIGPLVDPVAHGGKREDAFHVIAPSLPGYGFSDKPNSADWNIKRIAGAWIALMQRLGYRRFVAQGGDWGAAITAEIGRRAPKELLGIHLNMVMVFPGPEDMKVLTEKEKKLLADGMVFATQGRGYSEQQRTKPQTLGYGLADSPIGQAAWIYDKFRDWSDCNGDPLNSYSLDELLDNIMLYWLTNSGASSGRLYATVIPSEWEDHDGAIFGPLSIPVGASIFPKEMHRPSRRWVERKYSKLIHFNELDKGGHFAAFEVPDLFVTEMRNCFRTLRSG